MGSRIPVTLGHAAPLASEVLPSLSLAFDLPEILRCLGYPAAARPAPHLAERIEAIVAQALPRLEPRGAYTLHPVASRTPSSLALADETIVGNVGEYLRPAARVAAFVVTVGDGISRLTAEAFRSGDPLAGYVHDAFGSWAAEAAAEALMTEVGRHLGRDEALTLRYSPGYCGMDLVQQRAVLRLARAESVGVTLLPTLLMQPVKSISGLVGLGPRDAVQVDRTPCDRCPQTGCHMRR